MWYIKSSVIVTFGILVLFLNSGTAVDIKDHGCTEIFNLRPGSPISFSNIVNHNVAKACRWTITQMGDAKLKCKLTDTYSKYQWFPWHFCEGGVTILRRPHRTTNIEAIKPQSLCTSGDHTISLPFTHDGVRHSTIIQFNDMLPDGKARNAVLLCTVESV